MTSRGTTPEEVALAAIWEQHRPTMLERVAVLDRAAAALSGDELGHELEGEALRAAHQLAGAVGTFGYWRATERARETENILRGDAPMTPGQAPRLTELAASLREELVLPPFQAGVALPPEVRGEAPLVFVVDDDPTLTDRLAQEAGRRGMRVEVASTPAEARALIEREAPDAVVLDLDFGNGNGTRDAMALLSELAGRAPAVPVLVLTILDGFTDRIEVARRGAAGFLEKSMSPSDALDQVAQVLERVSETGTRILAVDDDAIVLATTRALLAGAGLDVVTLDDPLRFWDELKRVEPALLLLDFDMPGASGPELCRMLRNDPRWAAVPVLIMTARRDDETVQQVFSAGADDYLVKPVVGAELVTRVVNRLDRFRLHQALAETDTLTGLANRRTSTTALTQLVRLSSRFTQPLCLAELDLDHFKRVNDRYGHAAGDAALRRLGDMLRRMFRGEDVVARWGGEEFIVGMYGLDRAGAVGRMRALLKAFSAEEFVAGGERFSLTFSAGVAEYPHDGADLEALYRAADDALYRAKAAGRDQVMSAAESIALPQEVVDVAVVEDDDATAEVLCGALGARGYRWRRFSDGGRAAEALSGKTPVTRARLILLDVDLPTLSGFDVLDRLARDGVLRGSRVLMLTGRAGEADVLQALELGAFDHISKPFSVPVLMQKVSRAFER